MTARTIYFEASDDELRRILERAVVDQAPPIHEGTVEELLRVLARTECSL